MFRFSVMAAFAIFVADSTPALAGEDIKEICEAFSSNNSIDADCTCIADAISENPSIEDEFIAVETMDDYENSSDELKEAISQCHG
ncbi:MAG: hypothetical protein R3C51_12095 [Parvularculaceae bacterium]